MIKTRYFVYGAALLASFWGSSRLQAQVQLNVGGRQVEFHGFASQSYLYSDQNNFGTMRTDGGSFGLTDGGLNVSTRLTDKFRVGAQMYVRHLGDLSNGTPELDWAYGDYRFADWFGVRAGKVKTVLGLYNDTQDLDFLNTWALLPQSIYPIDLRSVTIAHEGGDIYGSISSKNLGTFSYTGYVGWRPNSDSDGYVYGMRNTKINLDKFSGATYGGDVRWQTPIKGVLAGASIMQQTPKGSYVSVAATSGPVGKEIENATKTNQVIQYYAQYQAHGLRIDAEHRRNWRVQDFVGVFKRDYDQRSWYVSAAYRINRWIEVGGYRSQYVSDARKIHGDPANHVFDWVASVRVDVKRYWNWKVESHVMNGYASPYMAHGFYTATNPHGLKADSTMLVVRTGFNF